MIAYSISKAYFSNKLKKLVSTTDRGKPRSMAVFALLPSTSGEQGCVSFVIINEDKAKIGI